MTCLSHGGAVAGDRVAVRHQEEVRPLVQRFDVGAGHWSRSWRRVQRWHALRACDAMVGAVAQLGPNVGALVVEVHTELGMPVKKVARVLRNDFGLSVTEGGVVQLLHRAADATAPAYAALREQMRRSAVIRPDETGCRVNAVRQGLWAFGTAETTVYPICEGRGFAEAAESAGG